MASLVVAGDTSGTITIAAPAVAGSGTLTLPVATDTLVGKATTDTLTNKSIAATQLTGTLAVANGGTGVTTKTGTGAVVLGTGPSISSAVMTTMASSVITSGTAQTAPFTPTTSAEFTGIPSWVKRITIMFNGISGSGTSLFLIQLGSTTFTTSGYAGTVANTSATNSVFSTGFTITANLAAATLSSGSCTLTNLTGNIWTEQGLIAPSVTAVQGTSYSAGAVTIGGTLDRIRITTVNGTDTFDAGSVNILYE